MKWDVAVGVWGLRSTVRAYRATWLLLMIACSPKPRPWPEVPDAPSAAPSSAALGEEAGAHDWSFVGSDGPSTWGSLRPQWSACSNAPTQSPVDLPLDVLSEAGATAAVAGAQAAPFSRGKLESRLGDLPLEVSSDGRIVQLTGAASQTISVDGKVATLKRGELRRPAEHVLGGVTFDFEIVLWFGLEDGSQLGLSLLFRQGARNDELAGLIDGLPKMPSYAPTPLTGRLPLATLLGPAEEGGKFLSYWGSESVPPCTAPVARLVLAHVGELATEQLEKLRIVLPSLTARPVQPLGDRVIGIVDLAGPVPTSAAPAASPPGSPSSTSSAKPPTAPKK